MDSPDCLLLLLSISVFTFQFFCFTLYSCRFRAVESADSCRLASARYNSISYRIVSYRAVPITRRTRNRGWHLLTSVLLGMATLLLPTRGSRLYNSELSMGWVDPWVGLGWVGLGWVGSGWVEIFQFLVCWVGLGPLQQKC